MRDKQLIHFHHKYLTAVLLIAVLLLELRKGYFKGAWGRLRGLPYRRYVMMILAALVASVILMFGDVGVRAWIQAQPSSSVGWFMNFGGIMGRSTNCWTALGWAYLAFYVARYGTGRRVIFGTLFSSFVTGLLATLFKFTFLRARPYGGFGSLSFFNFAGLSQDSRVYQSFPSGDVAVVAGCAGYLLFISRDWRWGGGYLRWALLLLPLATAFARVAIDKHWPSDTIFSLGLGMVAGNFVCDYERTRESL